jgi:3-hydroxyisobutyrate dehydrogenase-like beta-hydroxyacid dehydrogenase
MINNKLKIGWIGTGKMGSIMCDHLINAGLQLFINNRTV